MLRLSDKRQLINFWTSAVKPNFASGQAVAMLCGLVLVLGSIHRMVGEWNFSREPESALWSGRCLVEILKDLLFLPALLSKSHCPL